jgi:HlyD family secretion protein
MSSKQAETKPDPKRLHSRSGRKALWLILFSVVVVSLAAAAIFVLPYSNQQPVQAVEQVQVPSTVSCLGHIEPEDGTVRLGARSLSGQPSIVSEMRVKEEDTVRRGQIVAILNSNHQLEAAWRQAEANVRVAEARLAQARAGVAKTADVAAQKTEIARFEIELANAEQEYKRMQSLHENGLVSTAALDSSRLLVDTRVQLISNARERLRSLEEVREIDVGVLASQVEAARADVNRTRAEYESSIIYSPYDGLVVKVHAWPGAEVGPAGLVEIAKTRKMYVIAEVAENDINRVKVGQRATITGDSFSGKLEGTVEQGSAMVAPNSVSYDNPRNLTTTRVIEVKILLDESKVADRLIHAQVVVHINAQ